MNHKNIAIKAAKEAGKILKKEFSGVLDVKAKEKHDIVSNADYRSEKEIIKTIKKVFPLHSIIAEESGKNEKKSDYVWYVDPLDGTSNFVTGNPYFSVSIALALKGKVVLGVVYNPILEELYLAEKNKGAYLKGKKLYISGERSLENVILASAYSSKESDIKKGLRIVEKLALNSRKVVINFSPALDLCNIANGRLDGLIDNGTTPEDHAAGSLIVTEAGGKIRNYNNQSWNIDEIGIIASNKKIYNSIIKIIS